MKHFIILSIVSLFIFPPVYAQQLTHEEVVEYANRVMRNIYNDIWRIRNRYPQLKDFGPQNFSDTMELSSYYTKIKKLRIESKETQKKRKFLREEQFTGDKDTLYICFNETSRVYGSAATPNAAGKFSDFDLYLLIYINTDDQFFKHDMINIVKQNAAVAR